MVSEHLRFWGSLSIGSIQALYGGYEYAPFKLNGKYNLKDNVMNLY